MRYQILIQICIIRTQTIWNGHIGKEDCWIRQRFLTISWTCFYGENVGRFIVAAGCIEIYDSIQDFLDRSGWKKDNPELCAEAYLLGNRICCYIQGTVWYFSRIRFESMNITFR